MHRVFRLKPHLRAVLAGHEQVFLIGEHDRFLLSGRLTAMVVPLLDGNRSQLDLMTELRERCSPAEVLYTLTRLEQRGYITATCEELPPEKEAYWQACGVGHDAFERIREARVGIDTIGATDHLIEATKHALKSAMLEVDDNASLRFVLTDDYLRAELADYARHNNAKRQKWFLIKPVGKSQWLGPLFRPDAGPCWHCLAHRLRHNRPVEHFLSRQLGQSEVLLPPYTELSSASGAALHLAASMLSQWVASDSPSALEHSLWSMDTAPLELVAHTVVQRPQCSICGDPNLVAKRLQAPVIIESRQKLFTEDGGHRCCTPEETLSRHKHHVSPITGIVAHLAPIPDRTHPLRPVFGATVMNLPTSTTPRFADFTRYSLGKGRTCAQAEAGALCEAIERATMRYQGDEPLLFSRVDDLDAKALEPETLQNFSEDQYRNRKEHNARISDRRCMIPTRFDRSRSIAWLPAWSLTHQQRRYLPAAYCYANLPCDENEPCCLLDGNGHAAGNCLEEAILQASLELAERDAVGIWWYNRLLRPLVELASFKQPYFDALSAHYAALGHQIWVLDVTNDLGIPSFAALVCSRETGRFGVGFGAHFDPVLGIQRALTEVNQTFDASGRLPSPWGGSPLESTTFLLPDKAQRPRTSEDFAYVEHADLAQDIEAFARQAANLGLETLVQDPNSTRYEPSRGEGGRTGPSTYLAAAGQGATLRGSGDYGMAQGAST
ncbi:MAG: TOMM precursor leader peptide-binding protein [Polyangiaceae bacterium]